MLPGPPTNYTAVVDPPTFTTISWVNGANANGVRHEISTDGGQTWERLDDDIVPATTSDHSLPENSTCLLRGKSRNVEGDSEYTPAVKVATGIFDPQ